MENYQVSVVTPFHNVDLGMFRYAYESLQKQTLGFENIQWIVVLHNTAQEYSRGVHEMLDGEPNVIIRELDNEIHTPSSPRNFGMTLATAPYLGFLDADDGYTPECLEVALRHLQGSQSDLVVFRREYEMEKEGLMPATEIVLWDQTQEEIIMDRENWDDEKMFGGLFWGMVTSRLYRRDFITSHGFTFDETVPFTEDVLFLIELYGKAQRVCYLPQLIGYHYFINGNSLVQSMAERDGDTLVSYAVGFRKIFDTAFRNGIYIDELMAMLLATFAYVMVKAKKLTLSQRIEIKEILEPYVHQIRLLPASKLISAEEAQNNYYLPREVILHPENFDKGGTVRKIRDGQSILMDILKENLDTDYGRRYHFANLRTKEGYQARVPLADYNVYAPLVKLQTRIGESGIFTSSPIPCYLLTSGTVGEPKLMPATRAHLKPYCEKFASLLGGGRTFLLGESLPQQRKYNDQAVLNSLFGWVITHFCHQEKLNPGTGKIHFTAPLELIFPPQAMETIYLRLLFALRDREVEQILSPFTWGVMEAFGFLERHWQQLCRDIELGEITFELDVPKDFLFRLQESLRPAPERASELREIFAQGFERPVATRIWPRLRRLVAAGTGCFAVYTEGLKKYLGDLPHENGIFASSEALIGRSVGDSGLYELVTGQNFYEFRPLVGEDRQPLFISQLQEGEPYELIVTNRAGLYRYVTGDVLRIEQCREGKVLFSFAGRLEEALPLAGEFLWEQDIYQAIGAAARAAGLNLLDYSYWLQEDGTRQLKILLETEQERGSQLAADIDGRLRSGSRAYDAAREQELAPCAVSCLNAESHLLYRDMQRLRHKMAPDQIKPAHFLKDMQQIQFFMSCVAEERRE